MLAILVWPQHLCKVDSCIVASPSTLFLFISDEPSRSYNEARQVPFLIDGFRSSGLGEASHTRAAGTGVSTMAPRCLTWWCSQLCVFLCPWGLDLVSCLWWVNFANRMAVFSDIRLQKVWFHLTWACWWNKNAHCYPIGRPGWQRTKGCLRSYILHQDGSLWETLSQRTSFAMTRVSTLRNWASECCYLKPQSFEIICYAALDN